MATTVPVTAPAAAAGEKHESAESLLAHLEEKVIAEVRAGGVYEALQYIQSFIARKKKVLGQRSTSAAVWLGTRTLLKEAVASAASLPAPQALPASAVLLAQTAGELLRWFIEEGAGPENHFHLHAEPLNTAITAQNGPYCDVALLLELLTPLDARIAGPIVDAIYSPLHVYIARSNVNSANKRHAHLSQRIHKCELLFAQTLQRNKRYLLAFKSLARLQDAEQLALCLSHWASEGYATEKPLFFARALLQLLAEKKPAFAKELLHAALPFVEDNVSVSAAHTAKRSPGDAHSAPLAVWHVAVILTDLANFAPMPRVDKTKLFGLLHRRYGALFVQLDVRLLEVFLKAGESCFRYVLESPADSTPSPMAMLQSLLAGGAPQGPPSSSSRSVGPAGRAPAGPGGMDFSQLMSMMSKLQGKM